MLGIFFGDLPKAAVADLAEFAFAAGAHPGAAFAALAEQAHLAEEVALVEIGKHDLVTVLVLDQDGDRAFDDVIQHVGRIAGVDDDALGRVAPTVTVLQEAIDRRVAGGFQFGKGHSNPMPWAVQAAEMHNTITPRPDSASRATVIGFAQFRRARRAHEGAGEMGPGRHLYR